MNIWKRNLLARLQAPTDGEGSDLGGSATEDAINQLGEDPPQDEQAEEVEPEQEQAEPEKPASKMAALLDELTEGSEKPEAKAEEEKPVEEAKGPKPPEAEEAELLEGVKSERGKERIKQVFQEKKALEQDLNQFRELVQSTGMTPQDFAQTLEFGRLVNSGDEKNLRVALEMVESQRAMLYQKLGVEAPGVDLLKDHEDLKAAVDNMEITRERAVELAKYRKQQREVQERQQVQQQSQQDQQQFQQQVQQAAGAMEAYLETRKNEVDHPARMKVITEHFKNPANLQAFVSTYQPHQWAATVKMMYDNIQVPRGASQPQPIRSRPARLGTPEPSAATPIDRIAQRMESMGL